MPKIGVISGATSMAPMTTAVLFWTRPKVAMAVEALKIRTNKKEKPQPEKREQKLGQHLHGQADD